MIDKILALFVGKSQEFKDHYHMRDGLLFVSHSTAMQQALCSLVNQHLKSDFASLDTALLKAGCTRMGSSAEGIEYLLPVHTVQTYQREYDRDRRSEMYVG